MIHESPYEKVRLPHIRTAAMRQGTSARMLVRHHALTTPLWTYAAYRHVSGDDKHR